MDGFIKPTLHTAWCDYIAMGEGRTLIGFVSKARDEPHMREIIRERLGEFWSVYAQVGVGVVRNEVTELLWAPGVFAFLERGGADAGIVEARAELHANFG